MSESGAQLGIIDSRNLIYLPQWVRTAGLCAFGLVLLLACVCAAYFLRGHQSDLVIFCLSVAQTTATVFFIVILLLFSQRDANIKSYLSRSDEFLSVHVLRALKRISVPMLGIEHFAVQDTGRTDIFGRLFVLASEPVSFRVWVGINVHRLFVIYLVRVDERADFTEHARKVFQFTFGGASTVGFVAHYEQATVQGERLLSIWLTAAADKDLLTKPSEKLFWSQDIAMMTESFIRTARRHGIDVNTTAAPGPL